MSGVGVLHPRAGHTFQQTHITGGRVHLGDSYSIDLNESLEGLPYAVDATFNSYYRQHESICLLDTRQDVLSSIYTWADGVGSRVFWLNGWAGVGKSTIARTVSRTYHERGQLGANFFFSKNNEDTCHAGKFVTTLARQLACNVPGLWEPVCNAAVRNSHIAYQSLRDQWRRLVLEPLSGMSGSSIGRPPIIIVLDALDECDSGSNAQMIIGLISDAQAINSVRLHFLVTSRPELAIRLGFQQNAKNQRHDFVLQNVSQEIVDRDILIFLEHRLRDIARQNDFPTTWPGHETLSRLMRNAEGLFIWAVTACRFISEGGQFAKERLSLLLNGSTKPMLECVTHPEKQLYNIYATVLRTCVSTNFTKEEEAMAYKLLEHILGSILVLCSPISVDAFARLLDVESLLVSRTLSSLHSIMDIPLDPKLPFRLHHTSFRDFLRNNDQSNQSRIRILEDASHGTLASHCIRIMASLKQDIRRDWLDSSSQTISAEHPNRCIPPQLQYACINWTYHLKSSGHQFTDNGEVHEFLLQKALYWLEAMGWLGRLEEAVSVISWLESNVDASVCPNFSAFVSDLHRFSLRARPAIKEHPLQIYISAIVFAPTRSLVRRRFERLVLPKWLKSLPRVPKDWTLSHAQSASLAYQTSAYIVKLSPDRKQLASVSRINSIQLWNAYNGAWQRSLIGHLASINSIIFSSQGEHLFSASYDSTLRQWCTRTGRLLRTFESRTGPLFSISLSSDGNKVASHSNMRRSNMWEISTGSFHISEGGDMWLDSDHESHHGSDSLWIDEDQHWIQSPRGRLVWLPPEFRAHGSTAWDDNMAIGHSYGHVTLWKISFQDLDTAQALFGPIPTFVA